MPSRTNTTSPTPPNLADRDAGSAGHEPTLYSLPFDEWLAYILYPDTETPPPDPSQWAFAKRLSGAARTLLYQVAAARLGNTIYRIDGRQRTWLWQEGYLPCPTQVHVTLYPVQSQRELDDLVQLLHGYQLRLASHERILAALRREGVTLSSNRLRKGYLQLALNLALRGATRGHQRRSQPELDLDHATSVFAPELSALDALDPPADIFFAGVVAAALVALALYPDTEAFFVRLARGEGQQRQQYSDPVHAVTKLVTALRGPDSAVDDSRQEDLFARTLNAVLIWRKHRLGPSADDPGPWQTNKLRAAKVLPLITELKQIKGIIDETLL